MAGEVLDWTRDAEGRGWLCIRAEVRSWSEPVDRLLWWPIVRVSETEARDCYEVGAAVRQSTGDSSSGLYSHRRPNGQLVTFRLVNGGSTQPIRTEDRPVPRPRARKLRWDRGRWEKYTEARGWCAA